MCIHKHAYIATNWYATLVTQSSNKSLIDVQCDNLSTPANGEIISCSSGRVGVSYDRDTCSFTCNTGYELTGSDTRTCQSDGSWNGIDTMCTRGKCVIHICVDV